MSPYRNTQSNLQRMGVAEANGIEATCNSTKYQILVIMIYSEFETLTVDQKQMKISEIFLS